MEILERAALCTLHSIKGLGNKSLFNIKKAFTSFKMCFEADSSKLYEKLPPAVAEEIIKMRRNTDPLAYMERLSSQGIATVSIEDEMYPQILKNISNPPYVIYYKGDIGITNRICLAMVGSRLATDYGKNTARRLGQELARQGITVVSGMARGIDSAAHLGALDVGGKTVAVLGSGINVIYPRENVKLFYRIIDEGAVISEFPLDIQPEPGNFPVRNRIISGLCRGVIVVEAKKKSGALITADFALEQGRDVFAVPGPVNSKNSEGTNNLIKQGAKLASCVEDILEEYFHLDTRAASQFLQDDFVVLGEDEKLIVECISSGARHFDEIIAETKLDIGVISTSLLKLEFRGIVKALPGNYYVRVVE